MTRITGQVARLVLLAALAAGAAGCPAAGDAARNAKLSNVHYLLGRDYLKKRNPTAAKAELLKAIELDPRNRDAHLALAAVYLAEGVHAVDYGERFQCLKGAAAREQRATANGYMRKAEAAYRAAVKVAEDEGKIESHGLNGLAVVAIHFGRYDEAIAHCDRALSNILYAADRYMALANRGWARFKKGDLDRAAADLRQALFHKPDFCVGRYRLARVYYAQKRYARAVAELKRVVGVKGCPIQQVAHHLFGLALMKGGQPGEARAHFRRCVERNPKSCVALECKNYGRLI